MSAARRAKEKGGTYREVACRVGISEQTLRVWRRTSSDGEVRWRGRPSKRSSLAERQALLADLQVRGFHTSVESLQRLHPGLAKREVADLVRRARRVKSHRGARRRAETWLRPGAVWALDHTEDRGRDGEVRLVVRDLGSRRNLIAKAVESKSLAPVKRVLTGLFLAYGPPLVLRVDGAFAGPSMAKELERWGVLRWVTRPGSPWENGSVERANGDLKRRVRGLEEVTRGWASNSDELYRRAVQQSNEEVHPRAFGGRTPEQVWSERRPIQPRERRALRRRFNTERARESRRLNCGSGERKIASEVERRALERALVDLGYLEVRSERIAPPITTRRALRISGV